MILQELVYKYLTEGLSSSIVDSLKEDDETDANVEDQVDTDAAEDQVNDDQIDDQADNQADDQNNKTKQPDLTWNIIKEPLLVLYSGESSDPTSQYYPFSDEIRYAEFKKEDKKDTKDTSSKSSPSKFSDEFKKGLKNFALGVALGGATAATIDKTSSAFNKKYKEPTKGKKNSLGQTDKWENFTEVAFDNLDDFSEHALENHVPSTLVNDFINTYNELKQKKSQDSEEDNNNQNDQNNQNTDDTSVDASVES
jgi:hypothetical protein